MALPNQSQFVFKDNVDVIEMGTNTSNQTDDLAAQLAAEDAAFKLQQAELDATAKAQLDAQAKADADAFAKAQADIQTMVDTEALNLQKQKDAFDAQKAAAQAAADQAAKEAEAAQKAIAKQMARAQRMSSEMEAKSKSEMTAMQRTSAAKMAGSRKAGRSVADRSMLSGYSPIEDGPPTLAGGGGLGVSGESLGSSGTLGVGG